MAVQLALTLPAMSRLDLSEEERADLVRELRDIIANDRFPLSPRIRRLKRIPPSWKRRGRGPNQGPSRRRRR
jgi:hypothetical protein